MTKAIFSTDSRNCNEKRSSDIVSGVPKDDRKNSTPRIANRRAMHDYFIAAKIECGIVLVGTEVKSLRQGHAQLTESYARVEHGCLILHGCHIDPYDKASAQANHQPLRERILLVHKREIHKLEAELKERGTTLIPLAIYFKDGMAKLELGVGRGKQQHDKRETIRRKEQDREMRRIMSKRG
jgi:SsrA-binding protein